MQVSKLVYIFLSTRKLSVLLLLTCRSLLIKYFFLHLELLIILSGKKND